MILSLILKGFYYFYLIYKKYYFFSTDGSHYNNMNLLSQKKFEKNSILPDIKVNIIFDANQKNRSDSEDSDLEVLIYRFLKIYRIKILHI